MKSTEEIAHRYETIVPDQERFIEALKKPLKTTFRLCPLKASREEILELLAGIDITPLPFYSDGFVLNDDLPLGNHITHFLGLIYIQEAVSMIPPLILSPGPDDCVLDLCAAPGSKTTQLAQLMENRGLIIANDIRLDRINALAFNLERIGILNTIITNYNGNRFGSLLPEYFDCILIDAPCSAEATINRSKAVLYHWGEKNIEKMSRIQIGLLISGFRALKKNGRLVYSTCTFAPEENEMVINYLLNKFPEAEVLPINLPGLISRTGIDNWRGRKFDRRVKNCCRIFPQDNMTGGFFIARITKRSI